MRLNKKIILLSLLLIGNIYVMKKNNDAKVVVK